MAPRSFLIMQAGMQNVQSPPYNPPHFLCQVRKCRLSSSCISTEMGLGQIPIPTSRPMFVNELINHREGRKDMPRIFRRNSNFVPHFWTNFNRLSLCSIWNPGWRYGTKFKRCRQTWNCEDILRSVCGFAPRQMAGCVKRSISFLLDSRLPGCWWARMLLAIRETHNIQRLCVTTT